jgi:hypothetical protein
MHRQSPDPENSRRYQSIGLLVMASGLIGIFITLYAAFYIGISTTATDVGIAVFIALIPTGAFIINMPMRP